MFQDLTNLTCDEADLLLSFTVDEVDVILKNLLSTGEPTLLQADDHVCRLTQVDHVTGYSTQLHMPLWTMYSISKNVSARCYFHIFQFFHLWF